MGLSFTVEEIQFGRWLIALLPIATVLALMLFKRYSGGKAGAISWIVAMVVAYVAFGADIKTLAMGTGKGIWTTIFVLYIIWTSMAMYNLVHLSGGFTIITNTIVRLTKGNRIIQILTLGWAFPSFIQGVCGFGVPVAVAAPILVGIGFDPILAAAICLVGHSWSVTFGSLGSSYSVMVGYSPELDPHLIAVWASYPIIIACWFTGAVIIHMYGGIKEFKNAWRVYVLIAGGMSLTTLIFTHFITPFIASFIAGMIGMVMGGVVAPRLKYYSKNRQISEEEEQTQDSISKNKYSFNKAFAGYYILIIVVFSIYLTPLKAIFDKWKFGLSFPGITTKLGYISEDIQMYSPIKIFTAPGTMILISIVLAYCFYKKIGMFNSSPKEIIIRTYQQSLGSTVTVLTMSMMAVLMVESGMTEYLAVGFAKYAGEFFAIFSPMVGNLGAFMTGSNTNSNILFTALQKSVASVLMISPYIMLGLQTTGGALGNMWSPMNIALGTGVTGTAEREGEVMKLTIIYAIIGPLLIGLFGYALYQLVPGAM